MDIFNMLANATEKLKEIDPETLKLVKKTITGDVTDEELALFMYMCYRYNLDPLLGEIYFMKTGKGKPSFIVSRDGYLKIAMSNKEYQGLNSFVVKEGDVFEVNAESGTVRHKFGTKRGEILGAWAVAYRKGFKPQVAFVDFKEYVKPKSQAWRDYPSAMIQKVAEVFVLRRQFNITGIVAKEELATSEQAGTVENIEQPKEIILQTTGDTSVNREDSKENMRVIINDKNRQLIMSIRKLLQDKGIKPTGHEIYLKAKELFSNGELTLEELNDIKQAIVMED